MKKNNEELKKIILEKGPFSTQENERIYEKFFKDRQKNQEYIYQRFNIDFNLKLLDIGCCYGQNLIHFSEKSIGVEINQQMINFGRSLGLNIVSLNAEDNLSEIKEKFQLIWCTDFLVHMFSPYKFLYDCRNLLEVGGNLVIQIPLMSIFNIHRSTCHFYAFNKKSLIYILEMAGYEIIKTSGAIRSKSRWFNFVFEPILQYFGGNIWVLAKKRENTPIDLCDQSKVFLPQWFKV